MYCKRIRKSNAHVLSNSFKNAQLRKMNATSTALLLRHKEALISRMAQSTTFCPMRNVHPAVSRLSRSAVSFGANCNLPFFLDSLICPVCLYFSLSFSLFFSFPIFRLPIANPRLLLSCQDDPPVLSVTYTCGRRVLFRTRLRTRTQVR